MQPDAAASWVSAQSRPWCPCFLIVVRLRFRCFPHRVHFAVSFFSEPHIDHGLLVNTPLFLFTRCKRIFFDPETASSSGLSHVSSQPMSIPSPKGMISRESCLPPDTRNSMGTSGHVTEGLSAPGGPSSAFFGNSKNLALASCRSAPIERGKIAERREGLRKEPQDLQYQLFALPGSVRPGILFFTQKELFLKLV